ncbi:hypothetical protein [Methanoplanus endosymbiosus]|uniref:Uncharacterized protein n=1 Tax=Methanoplanus endosymbiosus TaxID=33865 RepID=A0A9E7PM50_9EURY|nr:hypothetical protein [Methanoplanus endosymbiosus]UUX92734.1 hypothetical protein L6E24_00990 [Methanoplanus endosymbiosus]
MKYNILPGILIILIIIPGVMADDGIDVWGYTVPELSAGPGDEVYAHYTIEYNFDSDAESIEFYTDLLEPKWRFAIVIDGVRHDLPVRHSRYETITGFELYYPKTYNNYVEAELNGTVPEVLTSGEHDVMTVSYYDGGGNLDDEEIIRINFVNPSDVSSGISGAEYELSVLKAAIDADRISGVNTTPAYERYINALSAVEAAKVSDAGVASQLISSAEADIADAYALLEKYGALSCIYRTEEKTESLDEIISSLSDGGSESQDKIWMVRSYNENAKTLIILAQDKYNSGLYGEAENYALQAEAKADEAYSYAGYSSSGTDDPARAGETGEPTQKVRDFTPGISTGIGGISGNLSESEDIDDLIHSEVSIESFLQISGKLFDLLKGMGDFLSQISSYASSN